MRFLADENIAPSVSRALRDAGHDVIEVRRNYPSVPDRKVIEIAKQEGRIIVTHDVDFGNVLEYPVETHSGVILLRYQNQTPAVVSKALIGLFLVQDENFFKDALVILNERQVRRYRV